MWHLEIHSYTVCIEAVPAEVSAVETSTIGSEKQYASSSLLFLMDNKVIFKAPYPHILVIIPFNKLPNRMWYGRYSAYSSN